MFRYFFHPGVGDVFKPELSFVFGEPLQSLGRSQEGRDKDLSKMMIKYWADFNKHDDPNGKNNEKVVWPKSESPSWQYLKTRLIYYYVTANFFNFFLGRLHFLFFLRSSSFFVILFEVVFIFIFG